MKHLLPSLCMLSAACLTPVDLSAKRCPCAPGFICDLSRDRCVDTACTPAVSFSDFRAEWSTSNAIRYHWQPGPGREAFVRYELRVAETADALETSTARVYGPDQNPELGGYVLQRTGGTDDLVDGTTARGLTPQKSWAAQLYAFDNALCVFRSPVVAASTLLDLPDEIVVFRDTPITGQPRPANYRDVPATPAAGRVMEWVAVEDPFCQGTTDQLCPANLKLSELAADLSRLGPGVFATAFYELKISNGSTAPYFYSRMWLGVQGPAGCEVFRFEPFTLAPGEAWQTLQVPLSALRGDSALLTSARLTGVTLCEANVGASFTRTSADGGQARVRVDDVRIRY
ncbi:MAG: hypothetical protein JNK82_04470 [Myxococcaceae bacterium]|nr:hypothetical protein [Myxococcaceae bacterium]